MTPIGPPSRWYLLIPVVAAAIWWLVAVDGEGETARASASGAPGQVAVLGEIARLPGVAVLLAMAIVVFIYSHGLNAWLPELLRQGGLDLVAAGYWAALPTVVGIVASLIIPRLATATRRYTILFGLSIAADIAPSRTPAACLSGSGLSGFLKILSCRR